MSSSRLAGLSADAQRARRRVRAAVATADHAIRPATHRVIPQI